MIFIKRLIFFILLYNCSQPSNSQLKIIGNIDKSLTEVSAIEPSFNDNSNWVIEDSGNPAELVNLNENGSIKHRVKITNAKNKDWEDLTTDSLGNIYIGDFGNNKGKRKSFSIYKISYNCLNNNTCAAEKISFKPNKKIAKNDFEAFFILDEHFYIFTKTNKTLKILRVKNAIGEQSVEVFSELNIKGKNNKITSADISPNKSMIALLCHNKIWLISNFKNKNFFDGTIAEISLNHTSQKEGISFRDNSTLLITDEINGMDTGNIYLFKL